MKPRTVLAVLALTGCAIGGSLLLRHPPAARLVIPNERVTAAALLSQKLSGPRYFQRTAPAGTDLREVRAPFVRNGESLITVTDAGSQVDRVVAERQLDARGAAQVRQLIDQLGKPPYSRMVGEASINLLRLNLALDELPLTGANSVLHPERPKLAESESEFIL